MTQKYYAQDTCFYNSVGVYRFEDRCEITKAAGYDATSLSVWDGRRWGDVHKLKYVPDRFGLEIAGVYVVLNLVIGVAAEANRGIYEMLRVMPEGLTVELAIKTAGNYHPSDPLGDDGVVKWLTEALAIASARNIRILIYSHFTHWTERHADALRLCQRMDHPNLGIIFCGYHWYAADGVNLFQTLESIKPYLRQVNVSGSRKSPLGWGGSATIEAVDRGEMDNFALIAHLYRMGYDGYIGYQGWDEGGDPFMKLTQSLDAMKGMVDRARRFPHWAGHIVPSHLQG
jgi:sugar phosphate isomerase/epimerase